jgi:hypothetical protein
MGMSRTRLAKYLDLDRASAKLSDRREKEASKGILDFVAFSFPRSEHFKHEAANDVN